MTLPWIDGQLITALLHKTQDADGSCHMFNGSILQIQGTTVDELLGSRIQQAHQFLFRWQMTSELSRIGHEQLNGHAQSR
jgi:hypothetical protein